MNRGTSSEIENLLRSKLSKEVIKAVKNPVTMVWLLISLPLTSYGIFAGYKELFETFGYSTLLILFVTLIGLAIVGSIFNKYMDVFSEYKYPEGLPFVYTKVFQHWHFNLDGSRVVKSTRDYVFSEHPKPEWLRDTVFGSTKLKFTDSKYASTDSTVEKIERTPEHHFVVYWKPKIDVRPAFPYSHQFSFTYPRGISTTEKSITIATMVPVGQLVLKITADKVIRSISTKNGKGEISFRDSDKITFPGGRNYIGLIQSVGEKEALLQFDELMPKDTYFVNLEFE